MPSALRLSFCLSMAWRTAGMPPCSSCSRIGRCSAPRPRAVRLDVPGPAGEPLAWAGLGGGHRTFMSGSLPLTGAPLGPVERGRSRRSRLSRRSVAIATALVTALAPRSGGPRRRAPLAVLPLVAPAVLATVAVGPAPGQLGGDQLLVAAGGGEQLEALGLARGTGRMTATTSTRRGTLDLYFQDVADRPRQRAAGHPARCPSARGHRRLARSTSRHHGCSSARCRSGGT